jgi:hypothetical protein
MWLYLYLWWIQLLWLLSKVLWKPCFINTKRSKLWKCKIHIKDIGVLIRVRQRFWCIQDQLILISLRPLFTTQILLVKVKQTSTRSEGLSDLYIQRNNSSNIFAVLQNNYKIWRFDSTTKRNTGINQGEDNKSKSCILKPCL